MVASLTEGTEEDFCTINISELEIADPNRWCASAKMEDYIQDNYVIGRKLRGSSAKSHID